MSSASRPHLDLPTHAGRLVNYSALWLGFEVGFVCWSSLMSHPELVSRFSSDEEDSFVGYPVGGSGRELAGRNRPDIVFPDLLAYEGADVDDDDVEGGSGTRCVLIPFVVQT